jgi:Tol biopolymer transport system component
MVSKHGYVKILDFGLAKLVAPEDLELSGIATAIDATRPGMVMGTVGYMSPEQAAGRPADYRSDQFAFGSILYELATGKRAFERDTNAETLTAIIREEPEPVGQSNPRVPAPVRWLIERCLAKDPEDRFGTTRDLARDLASIRDHLSEAMSGETTGKLLSPPRKRRWPLAAAAVGLLVAGLAAGLLAGRRLWTTPMPAFQQLTFRRGEIGGARFAPDGQTIVYAASWDGAPIEIFSTRSDSSESRPFGLAGADVLSVSRSGDLAVSLGRKLLQGFIRTGTLARTGLAGGGATRELLEKVEWADWSPDGQSLAVVRQVGPRRRLEFPIGRVLYETGGWISDVRVSPSGVEVAFLDHPVLRDDGGSVGVVDRSGRHRTLTPLFATESGLAWSPEGEIWFTAAPVGNNRALYSVRSSGGEPRLRARVTGNLTIQDISTDGRLLMTQSVERQGIAVSRAGQKDRELSWLDWSLAQDLSADGNWLLFTESGSGGGPDYSIFLRKTDGSPAVRLGAGNGWSLSRDGKWVAAIARALTEPRVVLYPTGAGEARTVPAGNLKPRLVTWMPDGRTLLVEAVEPGRGGRVFLQDTATGNVRAVTPEGYRTFSRGISPDGKLALLLGPDQRYYAYPLDGGEPVSLPGLNDRDLPQGWTADGRFLYVLRQAELPASVLKLELATGRSTPWKQIMPADAAGVTRVAPVLISADESTTVYSYLRVLSDLYIVEGVK